jgi:hypothetical protein
MLMTENAGELPQLEAREPELDVLFQPPPKNAAFSC